VDFVDFSCKQLPLSGLSKSSSTYFFPCTVRTEQLTRAIIVTANLWINLELVGVGNLGGGEDQAVCRGSTVGSRYRVHNVLCLHPGPICNPVLGRESVGGWHELAS
jgi:hypothetical protein